MLRHSSETWVLNDDQISCCTRSAIFYVPTYNFKQDKNEIIAKEKNYQERRHDLKFSFPPYSRPTDRLTAAFLWETKNEIVPYPSSQMISLTKTRKNDEGSVRKAFCRHFDSSMTFHCDVKISGLGHAWKMFSATRKSLAHGTRSGWATVDH